VLLHTGFNYFPPHARYVVRETQFHFTLEEVRKMEIKKEGGKKRKK
jgi:hypothetical protein